MVNFSANTKMPFIIIITTILKVLSIALRTRRSRYQYAIKLSVFAPGGYCKYATKLLRRHVGLKQ